MADEVQAPLPLGSRAILQGGDDFSLHPPARAAADQLQMPNAW